MRSLTGIDHRVARRRREGLRRFLDEGRTRVRLFVNAMPETHDEFLLRQFFQQSFFRLVGCLVEVDQIHRGLVRAAVQRTAQRPDAADDGAVKVRQRGGDHAHGERGRVELVFGVEHERNVHRADVRFRRGFAQEQVQEMRGDVRVVGLRLDALAVFRELIPIQAASTETRRAADCPPRARPRGRWSVPVPGNPTPSNPCATRPSGACSRAITPAPS